MRTDGDTPPGEGTVLRVLDGFLPRLRGLLLTDRRARPVLIAQCSSVHTIGMAYPLDIAFVSGSGRVLRVCRQVPAGRVRSSRGAACVVERPARDGPWLSPGDEVSFSAVRKGGRHASKGSLRVERNRHRR